MILKWLAKSGKRKPDDATSDFFNSLTGSPAAVLQQVVDWVADLREGGKTGLAHLRQADARLEPVLAEISAALAANRLAGTGHKLLQAYCEQFARAYVKIGRDLQAGSADKTLTMLRAAHLFSRASRLARTAFGDGADFRKECLRLFFAAQEAGLATQRKRPYHDGAETSILQELASALLWETAPLESLTPEQVDYLDRFIVAQGSAVVLKTGSPGTTAPYAVDANGRLMPSAEEIPAGAALFIGPGPLLGLMAGLAKLPDSSPPPGWAEPLLPHTDMRTLKGLAERMVAVWERKRFERGSARRQRDDQVRVTGGFNNIRRVIAYSTYVRNGGQLNAYGTPDRVFSERMREILVGIEEEKRRLTPGETLTAMETAGDSQAVESWTVTDSSDRGYSLVVPGYRAWLAVGGLVALREEDQLDWRLAVVRRLQGAAQARRVGLELLAGEPLSVGMGDAGRTENVGLAELRDAILMNGQAEGLLVTPFDCEPGSLYLVAGSHGRTKYKVLERTQATADFRIYRCVRAD